MFVQISGFALFLLVAGLQCAPAPGIYRVGFSHGLSGQTNVKAGGNANVDATGTLANGTASAKLGAAGSGQVDGSVFVQVNDKIVEARGDYSGSAGGYISPLLKGKLGKDKNGKYVARNNVDWRSDGQHSGAGSGGIFTNEDALVTYNEHHENRATDILSGMDDLEE